MKILRYIAVLLILIIIAGKVDSFYLKKRMLESNLKNEILTGAQVSRKLAREGNVKYFENKKLLNEHISYRDSLNYSAIHEAVEFSQYDVVRFFIENKYNINFKNQNELYPIEIAVKNCDLRMIDLVMPATEMDRLSDKRKQLNEEIVQCKKKINKK